MQKKKNKQKSSMYLQSTSINNQINHYHNHHRRIFVKFSPRPKWHNTPLTTMKKLKKTEKMNK